MKTHHLLPIVAALALHAPQAEAHPAATHAVATIDATLSSSLSSRSQQKGRRFSLRALSVRIGTMNLPRGCVIEAHIASVSRATPGHKAAMDLVFDSALLPNKKRIPLHARLRVLSKTANDVVLKQGTRMRMQAIADLPAPKHTASSAEDADGEELRAISAAQPVVRPHDDDEAAGEDEDDMSE